MRLYYQNVRGLNTKIQQVFNFICAQERQLDFFALTETWLNDSVGGSEIFPDDYNVVRTDRKHSTVGRQRGGGVLLAIRSGLRFRSLNIVETCPLFNSVPLVDIVEINLLHGTHSLNIFVVYIPPSSGEQLSSFFEALESLLIRYPSQSLILGDFNISKYADSLSSPVGDHGVRVLNNFCSFSNLRQHNFVRNKNDRILDLILSSEHCHVEAAEDLLVDEDSHHPALYVKFAKISKAELAKQVDNNLTSSFNFRRAHIPSLYNAILEISWLKVLAASDANTAVDYFYAELYYVLERFVPKTTPKKRKVYPPWFTTDIKQKLRQKYLNWRHYKKTGNGMFLTRFRELRSEVKQNLRVSCADFIRQTESQIDMQPNKFWSFVNSRSSKHAFPDHILYEGRTLDNKREVIEGFASHFAKCFSTPDQRGGCDRSGRDGAADSAADDLFSIHYPSDIDILEGFRKIKPNFSSGPDGIPGFLVSDCRHVFVEPLRHIFKLIIAGSAFPEKWKVSRVVPIFKNGAKSDVSNYRPIAILGNFCKVFEHFLYEKIMHYVKDKISVSQHGFISGRSTVTNLFVMSQYISDHLDKSSQVDVVYTDFSKAFDHLDHNRLLYKLQSFNFSVDLINLFRSYLWNRSQYVEHVGVRSRIFQAVSGVPQGSILGPLLFNLFVNDITTKLSTNHLLYADDMKLFLNTSSVDDCLRLQHDLDETSSWCRENRLTLNISKCSVISYHRLRNPILFDYTINGQVLDRKDNIKDLGVVFDSQLSFSIHVETMVKKCYKCMGFIMRNSKDFSQNTQLRLFNAFVRSRLEYASVIWSPTYMVYIHEIESVLRKFLKYVAFHLDGSYPVVGYPQHMLLQRFGVSSLEQRRRFHSVIFLYKIVSCQISCPLIFEKFVFNTHRSGARHTNVFYLPLAHTRSQQSSPVYTLCRNFALVQHCIDIRNTTYSEIKSAFFART